MAKRKIYQGEIPYDKEGNPQYYAHPWYHSREGGGFDPVGPEWRPNVEFMATMEFAGFGRGRSAAHFYLKNVDTGTEYTLFLTDLSSILSGKTIENGRFTGTFAFCKRGQNYGLTCTDA